MKEEQNQSFDDLFKMGFEDFAPQPSTHLWDNIEKELPLSSEDEIFRGSFANFEVGPSPVVWQNVQRRLPINLIVRRHLTMMSRVAAVLLLGMFGLMTIDQLLPPNANGSYGPTAEGTTDKKEVEEIFITSETVETSEVKPKQTNTAIADLTLSTNIPTNKQQNTYEVSSTGNTEKSGISNTINETFVGRSQDTDNSTVQVTKVTSGKTLQNFGIASITHSIDEEIFDEKHNFSWESSGLQRSVYSEKASISFNGGSGIEEIDLIENSFSKPSAIKGLVNPRNFYATVGVQLGTAKFSNVALTRQIGTDPTLDLGGQLGVNLTGGYIFNSNWSIETEANLNRYTQRFREVENQGKRLTDANLVYLQLPVMGKYRINKFSRQSASIDVVAGAQYNSLLGQPSMKTTLNGESIDNPIIAENSLANNELGLVTGLEVNFQMTDNISVMLAGRASAAKDLKQFFVGKEINTQFGLNLGASYRLVK